MQLGEIIAEARVLLQDTNDALLRFSDDDLLGFANQTLKRIAVLRPDLFAYFGEIPCTEGETLQSMPADSLRLMEIIRIKDGDAVRETNRQVLDDTYPQWVNDTAAACEVWMRHPRNSNKFFIHPAAPADQILIGEYAQFPPDYDGSTDVELLPDAYYPTVLDGVLWLAESVDNEHVSAGRAQMFQKAFSDALAVNLQSRPTTDTEASGMDEKEKIR